MRRLKILQIFSRYESYGGEESAVLRIGNQLGERYSVEDFSYSTREFTNVAGARKLLLPLAAIRNGEIGRSLAARQNAGNFDVWNIHNVFPAMSPVVYERAFESGVPVVHFVHNYRLSCANGFFLNHGEPCQRCISGNFWPAFQTKCWHESHAMSGTMGLVLRRVRQLGVFEKINQFIAFSEAQKREVCKMGIAAERIEVVPHFYEPPEPALPPSPTGGALFVGRLSEEKGVMDLLRAWKMLGRTDRELTIAGEGPERGKLEAFVSAQGLKNIRFTGFVDHEAQRELWQRSLFSLVPSIWIEPFGLVVLEAWGRGRAVLANDIGALGEMILQGQNGMLAKPFSVESLSEKLGWMFDHPQECIEMGQAGRVTVETRFGRTDWMKRMTAIYSRLGLVGTDG